MATPQAREESQLPTAPLNLQKSLLSPAQLCLERPRLNRTTQRSHNYMKINFLFLSGFQKPYAKFYYSTSVT